MSAVSTLSLGMAGCGNPDEEQEFILETSGEALQKKQLDKSEWNINRQEEEEGHHRKRDSLYKQRKA